MTAAIARKTAIFRNWVKIMLKRIAAIKTWEKEINNKPRAKEIPNTDKSPTDRSTGTNIIMKKAALHTKNPEKYSIN